MPDQHALLNALGSTPMACLPAVCNAGGRTAGVRLVCCRAKPPLRSSQSGSCAVPLHDAEIDTLAYDYVWERKSRTSPRGEAAGKRCFTTRLGGPVVKPVGKPMLVSESDLGPRLDLQSPTDEFTAIK